MELNRKAKMINQRGFLLLFMLAAGIVRLCFLADLPINAHPSAGADDGLLYNMARSLVAGDWLGDYNHLTMVKGPVFSLFLAACNLTGISFLVAESIIYTAGCILITVSVNKLFKKNWQSACFYLFMLLNPIASAARTY